MALIKLSGLVSSITGKLGGSTFQNSQGGLVLRNISAKRRGQTQQQQFKSSYLAAAQSAWRALTPALRTAFSQAVVVNPNIKKSYSGKKLSAHALFVRVYFYRFFYSINIIPSAVFLDEPSIDSEPIVYRNGAFLYLTFSQTFDSTKHFVIFSISAPYPVSRSRASIQLRMLSFQPVPNNVYDISDLYIAKFGFLPPIGTSLVTQTAFASQKDNSLTVFQLYTHLI